MRSAPEGTGRLYKVRELYKDLVYGPRLVDVGEGTEFSTFEDLEHTLNQFRCSSYYRNQVDGPPESQEIMVHKHVVDTKLITYKLTEPE